MVSPVPTATWPESAAADANDRNRQDRFHSKLLGQSKVAQLQAKRRAEAWAVMRSSQRENDE
jgi:hypothetical protein